MLPFWAQTTRCTAAMRLPEFERRAALYASLDGEICDRTRFFAAASLINSVFSRLFLFLSARHAARCLIFLSEAGAALEIANQAFIREINRQDPATSLDHVLVCAEQDRLQQCVQAWQAMHPHEWQVVRLELNRLLNDRCAVAIFSHLGKGNGKVCGVLGEVRRQLGAKIDFAVRNHRVCIGARLIEHIRRDAIRHREPRRGWNKHPIAPL
jgi:hypothetical protein